LDAFTGTRHTCDAGNAAFNDRQRARYAMRRAAGSLADRSSKKQSRAGRHIAPTRAVGDDELVVDACLDVEALLESDTLLDVFPGSTAPLPTPAWPEGDV